MNRAFRRASAAGLVAAGSLAAGCSGDARAGRATIELDTIGDTIVARVQGPAAWGDDVGVIEELRFGELEGADEYMFGNVVSLTVDEAGAIYVLDEQALTVRKFDASGKHLQNIGGPGGGPGELKRPHSLGFAPDGRLLVRDFGNARINFYDAAGASAGTLVIPGGLSTSTPMHIDTLGRVYTSVVADRVEGQMFRVGFQRFDERGHVSDTIRNPRPDFQSHPLLARSPDGNSMSATSVPFAPQLQWTLDRGGNVVWGTTDVYEIHTVRAGRPFRITRTVDAVPVGAEEKATEEERVRRSMKQVQPGWSWQGPGIPALKPYYRAITVAHDGRIWVQVSQPGVREPADLAAPRAPDAPPPLDRWVEPLVFDVFEPDGHWLARAAMPERFRPMFMRGDHIWGVQRDEYDVNYVVRLRMTH